MPARPVPQHAPGLISRELDGEFVVLQQATNQAHALSGAAAAVWRGTVDGLTDVEYETAVDELRALGLLAEDGLSRRTMIKRAGIVAAGVGVASIVLPMASAAASENNGATPTLTISPTTGPKGTQVTINGTGFAVTPGSTFTLTIGGVSVSPGSNAIDSSGNFSTTFIVPANAPLGADSVTATDNHNNTATAPTPFTVPTPTATLSSTTFLKHATQTFTVPSSSGFFPGSSISVTGTGTFSGITPTPVTATGGGAVPSGQTFSMTTSPPGGPGTIVFLDAKGNTVTVNASSS